MMKLLASCVWVCVVTAGSAYVGAIWKVKLAEPAAAREEHGKVETKKTRPLNIPIITGGAVQGYVVAQFTYLVDTGLSAKVPVPPESFLLDEAFKTFYSDDKLDFQHLERYDLAAVTKALTASVNKRLGAPVIQDILVEEFNYVSKDDISK